MRAVARGLTDRDAIPSLLALAAVFLGLVLGIAALVPDIDRVATLPFAGTVPASDQLEFPIDGNFGVVEATIPSGNCTVFVTLLDPQSLSRYNATGERPVPQLNCDVLNARLAGPVRWVIVENRGLVEEPYDLTVVLFSVRSTRAVLALPALVLLLGGGVVFLYRTVQRGAAKVVLEFHEQRERALREQKEKEENKR